MKQVFKGILYKDFLWKCATTTTELQFKHLMGQLKDFDPKAHDWLRQIPPTSWSRAHFLGRAKCEILVNSLCESLNSKLVDGRNKPIIGFLEYIREYLMKRIVNVQKVIDKCAGPLTPTATSIYDVIKKEANEYGVIWNGADNYQCKGSWNDQCAVNMRLRTCTYRRWELTGISCKHVVAAMYSMANEGRDVSIPEDWVHPAYWLKTWKETHNHKIECLATSQFWPKCGIPSILLPQHRHVPIGRPRKKKRVSKEETTENALKEMVKGGKLSIKGIDCHL